MTMWFFDESDEMEEYQSAREILMSLEREYREIASILQKANEALRIDPENPEIQARVKYYQKRFDDLQKSRLFASEVPLEVSLWGPPHG